MEHDLIGEWELLTAEFRSTAGDVVHPFGQQPFGRLIYTQSGYMFGLIMDPDRPRFAAEDVSMPTNNELRAALDRFVSYCGSYTVDVDARSITHHVEGSHIPNWVGGDLVRYFVLQDDQLELTTAPFQRRGEQWVGCLGWKRRFPSIVA